MYIIKNCNIWCSVMIIITMKNKQDFDVSYVSMIFDSAVKKKYYQVSMRQIINSMAENQNVPTQFYRIYFFTLRFSFKLSIV